MTILETLDDLNLFAGLFPASWAPWRACLAAAHGLPLDDAALALYRDRTGRQDAPTAQARELWAIVGRRGGKSRTAALLAVYAAAFRDWRPHLAPGEVATVAVVAADRQQARVCMRYINGLFDAVPMLDKLVTKRTASAIELGSRRVVLEVHTASFRSTRGYSFATVVCDELAFWRSDDSAQPDMEILAALRPGLSTLPGSMLVCISSPYARKGALWQAFKQHYGQEHDPVLVWKAPSRTMNATLPEHVVQDALAADEAAAQSEYLAEFRSDIAAFVSAEVVDACTVPGRYELPPVAGGAYKAFGDPSGGASDSMTLAIAHAEGERVVLDCVRERPAPFNPDEVTQEFAAVLKLYGCTTVTGDRYGAEWPRERFQAHGIHYEVAERPKSELYRELLPLLNAGRAELLDLPRLRAQLVGLERRTARGGRESIDHRIHAHDDIANSVAGALTLVAGVGDAVVVGSDQPWRAPVRSHRLRIDMF